MGDDSGGSPGVGPDLTVGGAVDRYRQKVTRSSSRKSRLFIIAGASQLPPGCLSIRKTFRVVPRVSVSVALWARTEGRRSGRGWGRVTRGSDPRGVSLKETKRELRSRVEGNSLWSPKVPSLPQSFFKNLLTDSRGTGVLVFSGKRFPHLPRNPTLSPYGSRST